jgi:predicted permease
LRNAASFSLIAVLTLALGIGANTAFFSTAYSILYQPLPYPEPERLIHLEEGVSAIGPVIQLRRLAKAADYAGYATPLGATLQVSGEASKVNGSAVSHNLVRVLGVQPLLGRWFEATEELPSGNRPIVISDRVWRNRFDANPNILGQQLILDERPHKIIGVMPASFAFPTPQTDFWHPISLDSRLMGSLWGNGGFWPIGRLYPNHTIQSAQAEIRPINDAIRKMFPWPMPDAYAASTSVMLHSDAIAKEVKPKLMLLAAAALLLLLIACGNVGNLLLARSVERRREFALRQALGASAFRLVRQLLTENLVLVALGGAAGVLLAVGIHQALPSFFSEDTPRLHELTADPQLLFGAVCSLVITVLLFTAAPLLGSRSFQPAARSSKLSLALIGAELALANTLLIGAALMGHTLWNLNTADSGVKSSQIVSARLSAGPSRCPNRDRCLALIEDISQTLLSQPYNRSVNWTDYAPLEKEFKSAASDLEDHPRNPRDPAFVLWQNTATPDYFRTLGIPLIEGRYFNAGDQADSQLVTIISQSTARRFWPQQSALGKKVRAMSDLKWRTIVGVVGDVAQYSISGFPDWVDGMQYFPLPQTIYDVRQSLDLALLLETSNSAWAQTLKQRYPDLVLSNTRTLGELRSESVSSQRSTATLLALFALLGLLLGMAGVHGVISHRAAQRTKEIGIRIALGANPWQVVTLVLAETTVAASLGTLAGVGAAYLLSQYLKTLLFGVSTHDPLAFSLSPCILLLAAVATALIPAYRSTHTDPALTLRQDG